MQFAEKRNLWRPVWRQPTRVLWKEWKHVSWGSLTDATQSSRYQLGLTGGTPSKARAKTPTHRLLTPPFETENIPVYTPPTDQQSTNLPGGQLNSRAGTVKEKKCARGRLSSNQRLEQMGQILAFKPVETEPDIWLKTKIKSETGGRGRFQMLNQPPPVYSYC